MSYVGELIMSLRESAPDLPIQTYPAPPAPVIAGMGAESFGALQPGTYYCQSTLIFPWGESLPSAEMTFTLPGGSNVAVFSLGGVQPGMIGHRLYVGQTAGGENAWVFFPFTAAPGYPATGAYQYFLGYPMQFGQPPTRSTAYVPDTNGRMLSAARVFEWLNDGLGIAGQITGGLPNFSGITAVVGQPWYTLQGNWKKIDGAWYNGYPVFFGRRTDVFRKNSVTGISAAICVDMYTDRVIVELWPQPSANGFVTALLNPIGTTDTTAALDPSFGSNFQTSFGFVKIGPLYVSNPEFVTVTSPPGYEIVSCQSSSNFSLQGMTRGWGGTRPRTWSAGTPVAELNGCLSGLIIPSPYFPGDSATTLYLPPGWSSGLHKYMLSRFREAERRRQEAKSLMDEFTATMQNLRTTRQYAGPIQIQANTGRGSETYPGMGGPFGGVIVP